MQIEFNFDDDVEGRLQRQIDEINESARKVRKKLFAEIGQLKKLCTNLATQNFELKNKLNHITKEDDVWVYKEGCELFKSTS
jgi:hypothetical protein